MLFELLRASLMFLCTDIYGKSHPETWAPAIGHYWRMGADMKNAWRNVIGEVDEVVWK